MRPVFQVRTFYSSDVLSRFINNNNIKKEQIISISDLVYHTYVSSITGDMNYFTVHTLNFYQIDTLNCDLFLFLPKDRKEKFSEIHNHLKNQEKDISNHILFPVKKYETRSRDLWDFVKEFQDWGWEKFEKLKK